MSVELIQYVEIKISSMEEPLKLTVDEAKELRGVLLKAFPIPRMELPKPRSEKWVLVRKTWRKGAQSVSAKLVTKVLKVVGKEWNTIDNICDVLGYSKSGIRAAVGVSIQEGRMRRRGRGSDWAVQLKTPQVYTPEHSDVPKIDVDHGNHDLSALEKENKLRREAMRKQ